MRTILHIESHAYRGVKISPSGIGYEATCKGILLFSNSWVSVEKMVDEILDKKS